MKRSAPPDTDVQGILEADEEFLAEGEGQIRAGKLAGKTLAGAIFILAMPVLLEQLLAAVVGLVDKMLTGGLPLDATAALDGVSLGSYVGWFIGIAVSSVGIGAQAIIARALGAGNRREAAQGLGQAVIFSLVWGLVIGVALYYGAPLLAMIGRLSDEGTLYCIQYIRTIAFGVPFSAFTFIGIMSLHGAGEATRPFYVMIVVNVVNVVASWWLSGSIIAVGGLELASPGDGGVIGIATGTVIARGVGAALILLLMIRGVQDLRLHRWALGINPRMLWRITRIGVPSFLEGIGMWLGNIAIIGVVGLIAQERIGLPEEILRELPDGTTVGLMGAHIIAVQWEAFSFLPGFAMGTAAATLVGQYLGAKNPRMASRGMIACAVIAMTMMGLAGIVFCLFGEPLTRVISDDPLHLRLVPD
ncbi:MAG: hypothetical protein KAS72_13520, partial [Phycisphaerales bacterium]|nr:hypothetical protein [Phycisphaerales bacterium]